uniref:Uncharacterized protein n=1 Tax=Zea mays TaxID=4577 RepID=A0A804NYR3_MAIZE
MIPEAIKLITFSLSHIDHSFLPLVVSSIKMFAIATLFFYVEKHPLVPCDDLRYVLTISIFSFLLIN